MQFVMFPPEILNLQQEICKHPPLLETIQLSHASDLPEAIAEILTYLQIPIDGNFMEEELLAICEMATKKLYEKRTGFVIPFN